MDLLNWRKKKEESSKEEDLKKPSKKKKKGIPQPWTKKERILVLAVFASTILISGFLAASARNWKLPNLPKIKLPSFDFLSEGTILIEGNKGSTAEIRKGEEIISEFERKTNKYSGIYAFYVSDLKGGFSFGKNENEEIQAASLIKLPVILAMYLEDAKGTFDLDTVYSLKAEDKVGGSGSLSGKPVGTKLTYRDLVRLMGKESDNTAFNICVKALGEEKVKETISFLGMKKTNFDENQTSPKDIGLFFKKLWKGGLVSEEARDEILSFMTDTIYEAWLAAGIPDDIAVAHKFGREVHVVNDAGIIFSDEPFIMVLMSEGVVEREADSLFPELSSLIYKKFVND